MLIVGACILLTVANTFSQPIIGSPSSISDSSFTAHWWGISASGYDLDVSIDNFSTFSRYTTSDTFYTVFGLSPNTVYHYRVSAAGSSDYSTTSTVLTTPATPVAAEASSITSHSFTAHWYLAENSSNYDLDVSDDNFATYSRYPVPDTTLSINALYPNFDYLYRVSTTNSSGRSGYSNTISVRTLPAPPVASHASSITHLSFIAHWNPVNEATAYEVDVSEDNFNTLLTNYNAAITSDTSFQVRDLNRGNSYQFRIRAVTARGVTENSNSIEAQTIDNPIKNIRIRPNNGDTLFIRDINPQFFITVTADILESSHDLYPTLGETKLFYRGITSVSFTEMTMVDSFASVTFFAEMPSMASDELGLEFYVYTEFDIYSEESPHFFLYRRPAGIEDVSPLPITQFGGTLQSYHIISIPLRIQENVSDIFEPVLGFYDKTKWRLVRYQNGQNVDYPGFNTIELGKSYWFNSVDEVSIIPFSTGPEQQFNQDIPEFNLSFKKGWNQIGNPYPFPIDWDDVLAFNGNPPNIGNYKTFDPDKISFTESNTLMPYGGGFVFADDDYSFPIPITLRNSAGGRKKTTDDHYDIDEEHWRVPLRLKQGEVVNELGGIGMHPDALPGKGKFDDLTPPRFIQYLEANFYHPEFFWPRFTRDVVPTSSYHEWDLHVESNGTGIIELEWDNSHFENAESHLYLFDSEEGRYIDMKRQGAYSFPETSQKEIKLIYSRTDEFIPSQTLLGRSYPNPASTHVVIPFVLGTQQPNYSVVLEIYNLNGKLINTISRELTPGIYEEVWNCKDTASNPVRKGMYLIRAIVNNNPLPQSSKLIVQY